MKDRLSRAGADVEDRAVSLLDVALARDLRGGEMAAADDLGVRGLGFFQSRKMFLGNDEHVRGRLRTDVFEGEHMLVFVNFLRGNLAADDAAEKAVGSVMVSSLRFVSLRLDYLAQTIPPCREAVSTRGERALSALSSLPILCGQIVEGLRIHVPGAFEGIVQVRENEVGEKQEHGCDGDRHQAESQVVKWEEEQKKQNHADAVTVTKRQKRARNPLGAEGKPFIAVGAGLVRNFQQTLRKPMLFRIVFGLDLRHAGQDSRRIT